MTVSSSAKVTTDISEINGLISLDISLKYSAQNMATCVVYHEHIRYANSKSVTKTLIPVQ